MTTNRIKWFASIRGVYRYIFCTVYRLDGTISLLLVDRVELGAVVDLHEIVSTMQEKALDTMQTFDQIDRIFAAHEDTPL